MAQIDNITRLQNIINSPDSTPDQRAMAQQQLDRLSSIGSAQVMNATGTGGSDADTIRVLMEALTQAVQSQKKTVSAAEVRKVVIDEMKKNKIDLDDLSDSLRAFLTSQQQVTITIQQLSGTASKIVTKSDLLERKLIQLILSDMEAKNNVYLYGSAGTGKTYVAGQIAKLLGWEMVTLNCNQYTSPLDILGGQTIEGYQEGKLSQAWANEIQVLGEPSRKVNGVVLLLDELPKIDPNTAGILNEALAKVKDFTTDASGNIVPPTIENGKGKKIPLGNLLVIGTGNVPLNTIDPDYEANFKQDLSLQDRFIGSMYQIFADYDNEFNNVMKGYAFIWLFCVKLREEIIKNKFTNQAFVSIRLMMNLKSTYMVYRKAMYDKSQGVNTALKNPKSIIDALNGFFGLFKETPKQTLLTAVDYDEFKRIVALKDAMPYDPTQPANYDTQAEIDEGRNIVERYNQEIKNKI